MSGTLHSQSPYPSRCPSPWPSPFHSRPASDSPSPSSSFRGDRTFLLSRKHTVPFVLVSGRPCCGHGLRARASSLDDVQAFRKSSTRSLHKRSASARSSRRRKGSVVSESRRPSRRPSASIERSRSGSARSRRTSAAPTPSPIPVGQSTCFDKEITDEEYLKKHRRHRIAFWMVLGSFIFIAFSSILVVVVTLTHQSPYNKTLSYYTFSKPYSVVGNTADKKS